MKENYSTTIDLDIYNVANDIQSREGNSESLLYIRSDGENMIQSYAGLDIDLVSTLAQAMANDEFMRDMVFAACDTYDEVEKAELN